MKPLRKPRYKKILKVALIVIVAGSLILLSELIYIYNNSPKTLANIYLYLAEKEIRDDDLDNAIKNLDRAASYHIKENRNYYKDKIPDLTVKNEVSDLNNQTKEKITYLLKDRLQKSRGDKSILITSNIYYNLGLIVYSDGYHDAANNFFQTSIFLHPELSFLFVELANSYFNNDNYDKGVETLKYCLKFNFPKVHCNEYLENNVKSNLFDPVGTFREIVPKYQGLVNENDS